jgi:sugar phosphate isomerase/epimerase
MSPAHPPTDRRRFLAASAAASLSMLAATRSGRAARAAARTPLQLGLVTYNWGKDLPLPELLAVCARTRFSGVELRSGHAHGVEPGIGVDQRAEVRRRFADSPVQLVGLGSACEYHAADQAVVRRNIDQTKAFIDLSAELGGSGVKVRPNALPAEVPIETTLEQIGDALRVVGDYAAAAGQQIRLEVHGRGTQEIPRIKRIMEVADHPHVVVCWNCNPTDLAGSGFDANFAALAPWMGTVHIHDLRPGKVDYPWDALFAKLKACTAAGFTGWCLLEDGAVPADVPTAMEESRRQFERLVS